MLDGAADIVFILDLLVNCNTSFEYNYEEICDRKKIIAHYLRGRFTVDFLSAFPIDAIGSMLLSMDAKQFKIFSLLKLIRMLRLSRIIRALKVQREIKTRIKLFKVFFQLLLYLHCQACLILFIIQYDKLWNNPILVNDLFWVGKFYEDSLFAQYVIAMNFSLLDLLGNNTLPLSTLGYGVHVFILCMGLMV